MTRALALGAAALLLAACGTSGDGGDTTAAEGGGADGGGCEVNGEAYPSGPIEYIMPYAAGGGTDVLGRALAQGMSDELGVQVNVVNMPEGSAVVGKTALANAEPDGSTIGSVTVQTMIYPRVGLGNVTKDDLTPISVVSTVPAGVTVRADAPYDSIEELLAYAEENPGELVGSGTGAGGVWDIARAGMLIEAGLPLDTIRWVPSQGAAPALQEVLAGGIDISFASLQENQAMIEEGRVKALAVMADEREEGFPDVPTLTEQGVDFTHSVWRGVGGPAGLPDCVVETLDGAVATTVESQEFIDFMANTNSAITYMDAAETAEFWEEQDQAMAELIDQMGIGTS
ncbi:tripartite tricarboxylate transporter substrate binding protein [Blastococcus sp. SYSU DS0973]